MAPKNNWALYPRRGQTSDQIGKTRSEPSCRWEPSKLALAFIGPNSTPATNAPKKQLGSLSPQGTDIGPKRLVQIFPLSAPLGNQPEPREQHMHPNLIPVPIPKRPSDEG